LAGQSLAEHFACFCIVARVCSQNTEQKEREIVYKDRKKQNTEKETETKDRDSDRNTEDRDRRGEYLFSVKTAKETFVSEFCQNLCSLFPSKFSLITPELCLKPFQITYRETVEESKWDVGKWEEGVRF